MFEDTLGCVLNQHVSLMLDKKPDAEQMRILQTWVRRLPSYNRQPSIWNSEELQHLLNLNVEFIESVNDATFDSAFEDMVDQVSADVGVRNPQHHHGLYNAIEAMRQHNPHQ